MGWVILGVVVVLVVAWLVFTYNGLIAARNRTQEAWSEIDVDLGPGLLGPVAGRDEAVVREDEPGHHEDDDDSQDDPAHISTSLGVRAALPARLLQHFLVLVLAHLLAPLLDYRAQSNSQCVF